MKKFKNNNVEKKRNYSKPVIETIKLDNEISLVMMSPPGDPEGSFQHEQFTVNPFKI